MDNLNFKTILTFSFVIILVVLLSVILVSLKDNQEQTINIGCTTADKLVLYMPFETGSNQTYTPDLSGYGYHALNMYNTTYCINCGYKNSGAYNFSDRLNGSISTGYKLNITNPFTMSAYFKQSGSALNMNQIIIGYDEVQQGGYMYLYNGTPNCEVFNTTYYYYIYPDIVYDDNNFHNLICTWNNSNLSMYVDGIHITSATTFITGSSSPFIRNLTIGGYAKEITSNRAPSFNGTIDEVLVYNKSLNGTEVQQLYYGCNIRSSTISSNITSYGLSGITNISTNFMSLGIVIAFIIIMGLLLYFKHNS